MLAFLTCKHYIITTQKKGSFMNEKSMQSKGGEARAKSLTEEKRSEIAQIGAAARWNFPTAAFGSADHPLKIGSIELPCYVLDDGKRVLVQTGLIGALGMSQGTASRSLEGGDRLTKFIDGQRLKPFISNELAEMIKNPISIQSTQGRSGIRLRGNYSCRYLRCRTRGSRSA